MTAVAFAQVKDYGNAGTAVDFIPAKIKNEQKGKYAQSISAVGIGEHPNKTAAMKFARANSTMELARSIEEEVSGLIKSVEDIYSDRREGLMTETVEILVRTVSLKNAIYAEEFITQGNNGYTAYVLRVIPAASIKEMVNAVPVAQNFSEVERSISQYSQQSGSSTAPAVMTNESKTMLRATQAWQDLEDRIEKEKAKRVFE
jgi:hypothetical protein